MSGWALFLLIALVLGIVIGNIMLLKHSANMKLPESVKRAMEEKKIKAAHEKMKQQEKKEKKPTKE